MSHSALKIAVFMSGRKQIDVALSAGISPGRLSQLANGWAKPTPREKYLLSRELGRSIDSLFPEESQKAVKDETRA